MGPWRLPLAALIVLCGSAAAYADTCTLRGVVKSKDGTPVPGTTVAVVKPGFIKPTSRQATTGSDGSFLVTDLPCGKYQVVVTGMFRPVPVEVKSEASVTVTVDDSVLRMQRRERDLTDARAARASRPLTSEEQRDEEEAERFRRETVGRLGTPADLQSYDLAPPPQKPMLFLTVVVKRVASLGVYETDAKQPVDVRVANAHKILVSFIERHTPAVRAQQFASAARREQASMALSACLNAVEHAQWPAILLLELTDASDGVPAKNMVRQAFGQDSADIREWDDHLSPRWRGNVVRKATVAGLEAAMAVSRGEMSFDDFAAKYAMSSASDPRRALTTVAEAFGTKTADEYMHGNAAAQADILKDATLMAFALNLSYFLDL